MEEKGSKRRRRLGLAVLAIAAVGATLVCWSCRRTLPTGSGPAGPPVPADPFAQTWHEGRVLLLGVGDSITAGFGATPGFSYFDRLVANPPGDAEDVKGRSLSAVFPKLAWRNISMSGSTSIGHLEYQVGRLSPEAPDVVGIVTVTTGGNDIIHNYGMSPPVEGAMYGATHEKARPWIANFEKRLEEIVLGIKAGFPGGCHIFLANIYDPTDETGDTGSSGLPPWGDALKILGDYNDIIARCAERHDFVHLVDIRTLLLGHGLHCRKRWNAHYDSSDPTYWYYPNIEDPNDRGYDAIRRQFLLEMTNVLAPKAGQ